MNASDVPGFQALTAPGNVFNFNWYGTETKKNKFVSNISCFFILFVLIILIAGGDNLGKPVSLRAVCF